MPPHSISTRTWSGPQSGSATSSTRRSPLPYTTTAFTAAYSPLVRPPSEEVDQAHDADQEHGEGGDHQHHEEGGTILGPGVGLGLAEVQSGDGDAHQVDGVEDAGEQDQGQRRG